MVKLCNTCGVSKESTEYHKNSGKKDGLQSRCKPCAKKLRVHNSENNTRYLQEYRKKYPKKFKEYDRKRYLKDKAKRVAAIKKRKYEIINRTPSWLTEDDLFLIEEIYSLSQLRTKLTGVQQHVDHIIPLQGTNVSGLHVPNNLQVISAKSNLSKNNRFTIE